MDNNLREQCVGSVSENLKDHLRVFSDLSRQIETIVSIADMMVRAFRSGRKLMAFGNGGSAADSQHLVGELIGRFYIDRAPLPAIALTTNTSNITAIANDYDYAEVFARQLDGLGQPGDVAVGISTSGRSPNVLKALQLANMKGISTVALTGQSGVPPEVTIDICLAVPSNDTPRIQEAHIAAIHFIAQVVERQLSEGDLLPVEERQL